MKLSDWANVAEIVASVVIVASLAYIGLELNQNTQAIQQESYQAMTNTLVSLDTALATDEELHRIVTVAESSPSDITADEWGRFVTITFPRYGLWEFAYLSNQENAVSDLQWLAFEPYFQRIGCLSGYRRFWEQNKVGFSGVFIEYVESDVLRNCGNGSTAAGVN